MTFSNARQAAITSLQTGRFQFEHRAVREGKNLLDTGEVTLADVIGLVKRCRGYDHSEEPHHADPGTTCHIFRPIGADGTRWYIKLYFVDDEDGVLAVFISVHRSA